MANEAPRIERRMAMNPATSTIAEALAGAGALGMERLDAQLLLLLALGNPAQVLAARRAWLLAHDEQTLSAAQQTLYTQYLRRRKQGEPLAYISGHKEFFGLDFLVDQRVLVPRPDTETLVAWALELIAGPVAADFAPVHRLLDLGTGSGAIALALKHVQPQLRVDAVDASLEALDLARTNAIRLQLQVQFLHGSWFAPVADRYHCVVSNPPYVALNDPHLDALQHEPALALTAGLDGLDAIRHIIASAHTRLLPGGWLLLEHGYDQADAVRALFAEARYRNISSRQDLGGQWRCTVAQLPTAGAPGK